MICPTPSCDRSMIFGEEYFEHRHTRVLFCITCAWAINANAGAMIVLPRDPALRAVWEKAR